MTIPLPSVFNDKLIVSIHSIEIFFLLNLLRNLANIKIGKIIKDVSCHFSFSILQEPLKYWHPSKVDLKVWSESFVMKTSLAAIKNSSEDNDAILIALV